MVKFFDLYFLALCISCVSSFSIDVRGLYKDPFYEGFKVKVHCMKDESNTEFTLKYFSIPEEDKIMIKTVRCNQTRIFFVNCTDDYYVVVNIDEPEKDEEKMEKIHCKFRNKKKLFPDDLQRDNSWLTIIIISSMCASLLILTVCAVSCRRTNRSIDYFPKYNLAFESEIISLNKNNIV